MIEFITTLHGEEGISIQVKGHSNRVKSDPTCAFITGYCEAFENIIYSMKLDVFIKFKKGEFVFYTQDKNSNTIIINCFINMFNKLIIGRESFIKINNIQIFEDQNIEEILKLLGLSYLNNPQYNEEFLEALKYEQF